jgi:photosystem II stability/assembly factor-like uncharacterized protein
MATLLYLGTDEGVVTLRHEQNGSWDVQSHALKEWLVPEVAVSTAAPNRVFAGTRGDGVWRSEDCGQTWSKPSYGKRGPGKVRCLSFDPHDFEVIYAGCEPIDMYVSEDLGRNWIRIDSLWDIPSVESIDYPVASVEPHVRDIVIDPKDSRKIYAALQVGYMARTADGGKTWKLLDNNLDADVHTIVLNPADTSTIIVATGGHDSRSGRVSGRALYMSKDSGENWAPTAMNFEQEYSVPLTVHPTDPNIMYAGLASGNPGQWRRPTGAEGVMVRTTDGGQTWEKVSKGFDDPDQDFVAAITFDEHRPSKMYAAMRSGEIMASEDGGDSWGKIGIRVPEVSDIKCVHD